MWSSQRFQIAGRTLLVGKAMALERTTASKFHWMATTGDQPFAGRRNQASDKQRHLHRQEVEPGLNKSRANDERANHWPGYGACDAGGSVDFCGSSDAGLDRAGVLSKADLLSAE